MLRHPQSKEKKKKKQTKTKTKTKKQKQKQKQKTKQKTKNKTPQSNVISYLVCSQFPSNQPKSFNFLCGPDEQELQS